VARALGGRGGVRPLRVYFVQGLLGGAIGAGVGFYLDAVQVGVVVGKFQRYLAVGTPPEVYGVYPLLSKWGHVNVGTVTGGASLLFAESLAGVISWSVPAWLFALNRTFMAAYFQKETSPITALFTREGLAGLMQNMLAVLRWGLWMSPIINSFLRPVGEPTWYNQDGAVRTLIAIVQDVRLSPNAFRAWSLQVFIALLAFDAVRILIWLDHMGLRVATLVNLSFLGMDRLEGRLARFLGPAATARCIPEGVKRFATWAPLLIPFYIPRGADWDYAWSQAEALRNSRPEGLGAVLVRLLWTDHGPWEGFNVTRQEEIRIQTSAHTLSLILGMLGTGPEHLKRYLDSRDLGGGLAELFKPGERVDLLAEPTQVFAWADKEGAIQSSRKDGAFQVRGRPVGQVGIAFVPARKEGVNLSGGLLTVRYHSAAAAESAVLALKPVGPANPSAAIIPTEIFTRLADTGGQEEEIRIPLPATPGLRAIKEVVLTCGQAKKELPVDLRITHFAVAPTPP
jgi:hypothetical protein